jgi:uncharacterized protein YkwD
MSTVIGRPRLLVAILLAAAAMLTALAQPGSARAAGENCAGANTPLLSGDNASLRKNEAAILCLTNAMRKAHDLDPAVAGVQAPPRLVRNDQLALAARKHSKDMAARDYFSHDAPAPNGVTLQDRVTKEGYCSVGCTLIAENIGWASGAPTPRQIVDLWMASEGHRANILNPGLREIGIGLAFGTPSKDLPTGGTFTQNFGTY